MLKIKTSFLWPFISLLLVTITSFEQGQMRLINGKPAYEYKISEINALFYGAEGSSIKIVVERELVGAFYSYEFRLKKLL